MDPTTASPSSELDSAAIFAAALSLWQACQTASKKDPKLNLSEAYNGMDEFMREVMRVATLFESWCCEHLHFDQLTDVWPYLLEDRFGDACLTAVFPEGLAAFVEVDCLRTAMQMRLPVKVTEKLAVPVDLTANNPNSASPFRQFQIRSVRRHNEDNDVWQYTVDDEPDDPNFGAAFFGLYGLEPDGTAEHIADRYTYAAAVDLIVKLAPGVVFPLSPTLSDSLDKH